MFLIPTIIIVLCGTCGIIYCYRKDKRIINAEEINQPLLSEKELPLFIPEPSNNINYYTELSQHINNNDNKIIINTDSIISPNTA